MVVASSRALQGEIAISIPAHVRLVMVAAQLPALTEPLMSDILRALTVSPDQVLQLTPDRVAMLPQGSRCNSWRLGTEEPLLLEGAQVESPAFNELRKTQRHGPRYGNKSAHMNTISSLEPTDLPAAFHIEKRAHAFPWSEKTFASNPGRSLSQFSVEG